MPYVPNHINFIWLGSMLRGTDIHPHQARLSEWKQNNPKHMVQLWFSRTAISSKPDAYQELHNFCLDVGIISGDIDELSMKKPVRDFIVRCMQHQSPNWGAISDLLRFYILKKGGYYFDTDIITLNETSELDHLNLPFGFALHLKAPAAVSFALSGLSSEEFEILKAYEFSDTVLKHATMDSYAAVEFTIEEFDTLYKALPEDFSLKDKLIPPESFYYSPDMIATVPNSKFIEKCIELIEAMITSAHAEEIFQQLHHVDPEKRRLATCYTTGEIAFAACLELQGRESTPFLSFDLEASSEDRLYIPNIDDFQAISLQHVCPNVGLKSLDERSYMVKIAAEDPPNHSLYRTYGDEILSVFYQAIMRKPTTSILSLFAFWNRKTDPEVNISQSFVLK
jgi:hypothetical protein